MNNLLSTTLSLSLSAEKKVSIASEHGADPENPVVKAIVFSRVFVPTYYICLGILVTIAAALRAYRCRAHRQRASKLSSISAASVASSSSSTLQGTESPPPKDITLDECTPLLVAELQSLPHRSFLSRARAYAQACLLYQPRPLPAVTAPANDLPSNGTTLVVILVLAINMTYLFYRNPLSILKAQPFADRAGLCFVANLPVIYLLGAKNNRPLKWFTGWSYEGLNIIHRRIGEWMVVLACAHAVGMILLWYRLFRPLGYSLYWFFTLKIIALGTGTFIATVLIYVTSTGSFRKRFYEAFLASHIFLQLSVLVLLFFHHSNTRPYVGAALFIWCADRVVTRLMISSKKLVATLQVAPDKKTVLLFCDVPLTQSRHKGIYSGWQPGQHVFLSVPEIGWKHRFQMHPFTIASPAPPSGTRSGTWPLQLIIRSKDGFSKQLLEYTKLHQHTRVVIDGPYGSTEVIQALRQSERSCLVAGGSGISVTYPLAWALAGFDDGDSNESILSSRTVYTTGVKSTPEITLSQASVHKSNLVHFWLRQHESHSQWITMFPRHHSMTMVDRIHSDDSMRLQGVDLISHAINTRDGSSRRPDIRTELCEWVRRGSLSSDVLASRICIVVSGPDELNREVRNCVASLTKEGYNIEIFVEKFGW